MIDDRVASGVGQKRLRYDPMRKANELLPINDESHMPVTIVCHGPVQAAANTVPESAERRNLISRCPFNQTPFFMIVVPIGFD